MVLYVSSSSPSVSDTSSKVTGHALDSKEHDLAGFLQLDLI